MTITLLLNPVDHAALVRVVDPDGTRDGTTGVFLVPSISVPVASIRIVEDDELVVEGKAVDLDPFTAAIIILSHNSTDDFEAVQIWAGGDVTRDDPTYVELIGVSPERIMHTAAQFAAAAEFALDLLADDALDVLVADPDTTLDGSSFVEGAATHHHTHPETLTEHGGEG